MIDLPNPSAGGSYLRDDKTGELSRVDGKSGDAAPAAPPDLPPPPLAKIPPGAPPASSPAQE